MAALLREGRPSPTEVDAILAACLAADGVEPTAHFGEREPTAAFGSEVEGRLAGVALLGRVDRGWDLAVATLPPLRSRGAAATVVQAAVTYVDACGSDAIRLWVPAGSAAGESLAFAHDFVLSRRLLRLEVALPIESPPPWPSGYDLDVLADADLTSVVQVNNRAFAWHEDQGRWTEDELAGRLAQPWVDRDGFLVARERRGGEVAGFCWTRLHDGAEPVGEIYVICADPARQGAGLGTALTAAGLAHLSLSCSLGMLYVDEGNLAARRTYRRLGFRLARVDSRFTRDLRFRAEPFGGLT